MSEPRWPEVSELIARRIGLHFPPERHTELQRGLAAAAAEMGLADADACAAWLLSATPTRQELHLLAGHLTIGETYFFREIKAFDALTQHILPELIRRRGSDRHLRLWSAACCTGEEPYSLAIALHESLLSLKDWRITLLATDINDRFLRKAHAAIYGEWSFRGLSPKFKQRYFTRTQDGRFALMPHIRDRVTFAPLNLAEDGFPSLATGAHAMDVIFCRNVLMYFTPVQAREVIAKLHRTLVDGGWLIVSQSELSHQLFSPFRQTTLAGAILYEKTSAVQSAPAPNRATPASPVQPIVEPPASVPLPPATDASIPRIATTQAPTTQALAEQARELANQGMLAEALSCCDRWIAADALDPGSRYLRAVILQEMGDPVQARQSLQHALYLQPDFVLAHFGLGNLARSRGSVAESNRHFANALALLRSYLPEDPLPQSEGLTAGRLEEILTSLIALELAG